MSSTYEKMFSTPIAPHSGSASATDTRPSQRITSSAGSEGFNAFPLQEHRFATLRVGDAPLRVTWSENTGSLMVSSASLLLPAYAEQRWYVQPETRYVYIEAVSGSAQAWVWSSSAQAGV